MNFRVGIDIGSYVFNASAKTITFSDMPVDITIEHLSMVTNTTDNIMLYIFDNEDLNGTITNNVLTLGYDTTLMSNTDKLFILVDIPQGECFYKNEYDHMTIYNSGVTIPQTGATIALDAHPKISNESSVYDGEIIYELDSVGTVDGFLQIFKASQDNIHDVMVSMMSLATGAPTTLLVDDFNYQNDVDIQNTWVSTDLNDLRLRVENNPVYEGIHCMRLRANNINAIGMTGTRTYTTVQDWSSYTGIRWWNQAEDFTEEFYRFIIEDDNGNKMFYDFNNVSNNTWLQIAPNFSQFTDYNTVNLSNIKKIFFEVRDTLGNKNNIYVDYMELYGTSLASTSIDVQLIDFGTNPNPTTLGTIMTLDSGLNYVSKKIRAQKSPHNIHIHRGSHNETPSQKLIVGNYYGIYFKKPLTDKVRFYGNGTMQSYTSAETYTVSGGVNTLLPNTSLGFTILSIVDGVIKELSFSVDGNNSGSLIYIIMMDGNGKTKGIAVTMEFTDSKELVIKSDYSYAERIKIDADNRMYIYYVDDLNSSASRLELNGRFHSKYVPQNG